VVRRGGRHDDDRVVGVLEQRVRHAAERGREPAQAARADDDLVGVAVARELRDLLGGRSLEDDRLGGVGVRADERRGELPREGPAIVTDGPGDRLRERGDDVGDDELTVGSRAPHRVLERHARVARAVHADHDAPGTGTHAGDSTGSSE